MPIRTFTETLDRLDVTWTETSSAAFVTALSDIVVEPAVGGLLPFDQISLPDPPVTVNPTAGELETARTGVTAVELAIADYGTIVIAQHDDWTEAVGLFPPLHVAILRASDIVPDMDAAFEWLGRTITDAAGGLVLATGPSATADMGSLVRGAHGPEQVHVIIVSDL